MHVSTLFRIQCISKNRQFQRIHSQIISSSLIKCFDFFSDALLNVLLVLRSINLTAKQLKVILWDGGFSLQMKIRQLEK